jgi:hypothetical protein
MSHVRVLFGLAMSVLLLLVAPSCGSGDASTGPQNTLVVPGGTAQVLSLPTMSSGDVVNYAISLAGGCGGPYEMQILSGRLPNGVHLINERHSIEGILEEHGTFDFEIRITDTKCVPFSFVTQRFRWVVTQGALQIVRTVPPWTPAGATPDNPDYPALPESVFGSFSTIRFVVAGGTGQGYRCELVDLPGVDETQNATLGLPQGVILSEPACAISGAPGEAGPPFVFSLRITDSAGNQGFATFQWAIKVPPILMATAFLPNGKCGVNYSASVEIVDGIAPFQFMFTERMVDFVPNPNDPAGPLVPDLTWDPLGLSAPVVNTPGADVRIDASYYPAANSPGPDYRASHLGVPPEGVFLRDENGSIAGTPRRRGQFHVHVRVMSSLVPNIEGQQNWAEYDLSIEASEPNGGAGGVPFGQDPAYTTQGAFMATAPYSEIPEAQMGQPYNPDAATWPRSGLQILARGGVKKDGRTDAPHLSQTQDVEGFGAAQERVGGYDWTINWDPEGLGASQVPGMDFTAHLGELVVSDSSQLARQSPQVIEFTAYDQQLPTGLRNVQSQRVRLSVGPDVVIVTESTTSSTNYFPASSDYNDNAMTVRALEPRVGTPLLRNLDDDPLDGNGFYDMAATHTVPSTAGAVSLQTLLTTVDFLRVCTTPVTWKDDPFGLHPGSARPHQHANRNPYYNGFYYYTFTVTAQRPNPSNSPVRIPDCTDASVTHNPLVGVYKNGGKLHVFDSATRLGVMVIRGDGRIFIPAAFQKGTYNAFGDGTHNAYGVHHSETRVANLVVSPNGRFAAMKLKNSATAFAESANTTRILLMDLTGTKTFGGQTWTVIDSGPSASTATGLYLYAPSMVLTNRYLYYLRGNNVGRLASWRDHYIYRYELTGGATAGAMMTGFSGFYANMNTAGTPVQTPYQMWQNTPGYHSGSTYVSTTIVADLETYHRYGMNLAEDSAAPIPFRVNANGDTCAILAGVHTANTNATDVMSHLVWVDDNGVLRRLTTTARHSPRGASRTGRLVRGPSRWTHWGLKAGPTTAFEVSDNGKAVAVVVSRSTVINGADGGDSDANWDQREDVVLFTANSGDWASGTTERQVTGADSGTTRVFSASVPYLWRFGDLSFTRDNNGLVFWGGYSAKNYSSPVTGHRYAYTDAISCYGSFSTGTGYCFDSTNNSAYLSNTMITFTGTYYTYNVTSGAVRSIVGSNDGGGAAGIASYSTSTPVAPTTTSWSGAQGKLSPRGSFHSRNGNFKYVTTMGAINTSDPTCWRLIGINVRSLDTTQNINGKTDGTAFAVSMQSRRGFIGGYVPYPYYDIVIDSYRPVGGFGMHATAKDTGWVYFISHYQQYGPIQDIGTNYSSSGPIHTTYYGDYCSFGGHLEVFSADVGGPVQRLTPGTLGADTAYRVGGHVNVTDSGRSAALTFTTTSTIYYAYFESLHFVGNISLDPATGVLQAGSFSQDVHGSSGTGRVSDAFSQDSSGMKIYQGFVAGTGSENTQQLYEASFTSGGATMAVRSVATAQKRYNVLHAGR